MIAFEAVCRERQPKIVVVGGDVNSTLAVALVAAKEGIPVAHVEAGLRSFERTMPEEINRVVTDHLSQLLLTTEDSADLNLRREGIPQERIRFVGNCMADTLLKHVDKALRHSPWTSFGLEPNQYAVLTLHRPSNVDDPGTLRPLMSAINEVSRYVPVVFPSHPRTRERLSQWNIQLGHSVIMCDPLPYITFLGLMAKANFVMTDSGGIQEEPTVLDVPCLTLRNNTERPITITSSPNRLVGTEPCGILRGVEELKNGSRRTGHRPPLWDGKAAHRIADVIESWTA